MKLKYEKPMLQVDSFELDTSIASNCTFVVNAGPAYDGREPCEDWYEFTGQPMPTSVYNDSGYNLVFYESCDCYTTGEGWFFTS